MLKNRIRSWCQKLMGFDRYLFFFSLINIHRVHYWGDEKEFRLFNDMIEDKGLILDIGANIGIMTVVLAKAHPRAVVYAFEPLPANCHALKSIVSYYKLENVKVTATALGDKDGTVNMFMPVVCDARMQGLSHILESTADSAGEGEVFTVTIRQLDNIPELLQAEKISAIKIDVENFEYYVLKGGEALLKKHKPIIFCELWNNERRKLCFELMAGLGYQIKIMDNNKLADFDGREALNYFFIP